MFPSHLFSRLRLATIKPAEQRHPNAPLARSSPELNGPFIHTSLPSWAANTLERLDLPREAASFLANRRDTGATYLVHGLQCGDLQLRVVVPVACPGAPALFAHIGQQEHVSVICDVDESTQSVELAIALNKEAAVRALAAPKVAMTDEVFRDEASMLFALAHAQTVPSLIPAQEVRDVIVLFCGDTAALAAMDGQSTAEGHQHLASKMH